MKAPRIPPPLIHPGAVVAPGARIYGQVEIGDGCFVLFGVVIRAEFDSVVIGAQTNIQDNTVIHADAGIPCLIGERVTIGHAAVVHGAVVGDAALIGIGARALNRSEVGEGAWLGAGSVLTEGQRIPPWTLAIGTPAKPVRELTEKEIIHASEGVDNYRALATAYAKIFQT